MAVARQPRPARPTMTVDGVGFSVYADGRAAWTCCCSTPWTIGHRAGCISIPLPTGQPPTGTSTCRDSIPASSTRSRRTHRGCRGRTRFDPTQVLLDPYGRAVATPPGYRRLAAGVPADAAIAMKSVVVDTSAYDWEGDRPLGRSWHETVIYEAHVRGFTRTPAPAAGARRGTYAGFIEKIPYLAGARASPPSSCCRSSRSTASPPRPALVNYWGYSPCRFFAPHLAYAQPTGPHGRGRRVPRPGQGAPPGRHRGHPRRRLQPHRRGRRTTARRSAFRGLDNDVYYILDAAAARTTTTPDCGNTLNATTRSCAGSSSTACATGSHEMHVDGFRFDLAPYCRGDGPASRWRSRRCSGRSSPTRSSPGPSSSPRPGTQPAFTRSAASSATRWAEWNGKFRDDVRYVRQGRSRTVPARWPAVRRQPRPLRPQAPRAAAERQLRHLPRRLHAQRPGLLQRKHNEANGEDNRDGDRRQPELELRRRGPDRRSGLEALRDRQVRNFLAITAVARRAHAADGRRGASGRRAATTTPIARTTRRAGSTGRRSSGRPNCVASRPP